MSTTEVYDAATKFHIGIVTNARTKYKERIEDAEAHLRRSIPGSCDDLCDVLRATIVSKKYRMAQKQQLLAPTAPARTHTAPVTTTSNHQCPHRLPSELKSPSSVQRRGSEVDWFSESHMTEALTASLKYVNHLGDDSYMQDLALAEAESQREAKLIKQTRERMRNVLDNAARRLYTAAANPVFMTYKLGLEQAASKLAQASGIQNLTQELAADAALIADEQIVRYNEFVKTMYESCKSRMSQAHIPDNTRLEAMRTVGIEFSSANLPSVFGDISGSQSSRWDPNAYMRMLNASRKFT